MSGVRFPTDQCEPGDGEERYHEQQARPVHGAGDGNQSADLTRAKHAGMKIQIPKASQEVGFL
jgi:hypothetical protein